MASTVPDWSVQIRIVWSFDADTNLVSPALKTTEVIRSEWPVSVRTSRPSGTVQILTVLSGPPEAMRLESLLNASAPTLSVGTFKDRINVLDLVSYIRTVSSHPDAMYLPSGLTAAAYIGSVGLWMTSRDLRSNSLISPP